jgi:hypothetical protein
MTDRQRKDRLIQTRVPQDLESTLKDEARKRRLSVSHLIRNVLEDTFNLVDNVVVEVDRVVTDSVEMAKTFQRDAQRLAATARGETSHRESSAAPPEDDLDNTLDFEVEIVGPSGPESDEGTDAAQSEVPTAPAEAPAGQAPPSPLALVYAWQELTLNRAAQCARCQTAISRGERAHMGLVEQPGLPRVWLCQSCLDAMNEEADARASSGG